MGVEFEVRAESWGIDFEQAGKVGCSIRPALVSDSNSNTRARRTAG